MLEHELNTDCFFNGCPPYYIGNTPSYPAWCMMSGVENMTVPVMEI